jgi:hypothetical protein
MILSSSDAKAQTNGVAPDPKKYKDWDAAVNAYDEAFKKGECHVKTHK